MKVSNFKDNIGIFSNYSASLVNLASDEALPADKSYNIDSASLNNKHSEFTQQNSNKKLEVDREILHREYLFEQTCADCAHRQAQSYVDSNTHLSDCYQSIYDMCMQAVRSSLENINKCERKISGSYRLNV
ncbi:hypothetical protein NOVO_00435 [Rickettsiales bacterium Ac37b]|nr:hypothetical protein NOVO_00435 [Rickettsiales bacterium Ac37b]